MKIELGTPRIRPQIAFKMDQKSQIFQKLFSKKMLDENIENRLLQSFTNVIAGIQKNLNQIGALTAEIIELEIFRKSRAPECVFSLDLLKEPYCKFNENTHSGARLFLKITSSIISAVNDLIWL